MTDGLVFEEKIGYSWIISYLAKTIQTINHCLHLHLYIKINIFTILRKNNLCEIWYDSQNDHCHITNQFAMFSETENIV